MAITEHFIRAFCDCATIRATCELCGRTHFGRDGDFEEGELEDLEKRAAAEPEKYVDHGHDAVGLIQIDGKQAVVECECGKLEKYEKWIWGWRFPIAEYIRERSTEELALAHYDAERLEVPTADKIPAHVEYGPRRRLDMEIPTIQLNVKRIPPQRNDKKQRNAE